MSLKKFTMQTKLYQLTIRNCIASSLFFTLVTASCTSKQAGEKTNSNHFNEISMQNETMVADYATDPNIEKGTKEFLTALNSGNGKPLHHLSPEDARKVLEGAQTSVPVDLSGIEVADKTISQDGIKVHLKIVRPAAVKGQLPVFIFFHGGGWVLGDFPTHQRLIRDLVVNSGAVAVYVDYDRSPEAHYPVAINQAYAATKWVAAYGDKLGVDGNRLAVAGNSVGGNMAAVIALMAKEKKGPLIKFQLLLWPVTNASFDNESYGQYAEQRFLTKNTMIWFWNSYTKDEKQRKEIYASPLLATLEQLKELPPALVLTAENDVLRDEGEAYARKMDLAGVPVTLVRYQGMIHDYGLLNPLAHVPAVKSSLIYAAAEIKKHLE
jgi:acetyl esterase